MANYDSSKTGDEITDSVVSSSLYFSGAGASAHISASGNISGSNLYVNDSIYSSTLHSSTLHGSTISGSLNIHSYIGAAAGEGIDTASPTVNVQSINSEVVTTIFIDIGGGTIVSSGDQDDTIGEDDAADVSLTRITNAVNGFIYKGEIICLEIPTTGDPDINLNSHSDIIAEDISGLNHLLVNASGDAWTLGEREELSLSGTGGLVNDYLYLTHGGTTAGTYNAGKFLIKLYGYVV